jgi:hypothetical protein
MTEEETEEYVKVITDIGDHFSSLTNGKLVRQLILPGLYLDSTELFMRHLLEKLTAGNPLESLIMAMAWGIYLAELRQTKMTEDLTIIN